LFFSHDINILTKYAKCLNIDKKWIRFYNLLADEPLNGRSNFKVIKMSCCHPVVVIPACMVGLFVGIMAIFVILILIGILVEMAISFLVQNGSTIIIIVAICLLLFIASLKQ